MKRQMDAAEDIRVENLNLRTQVDSYGMENEILKEKLETLHSQVDHLTMGCANTEELNLHLYEDSENLKLELRRARNSLATLNNLYSSSVNLVTQLKEEKVRIIKRKDKTEADLRKSRNEVTDLRDEVKL